MAKLVGAVASDDATNSGTPANPRSHGISQDGRALTPFAGLNVPSRDGGKRSSAL
jgi:hypothetical protein